MLFRWIAVGLIAVLSGCRAGKDPTTAADSASGRARVEDAPLSGEVVSELYPAILHVYQAVNGDYWFGSEGDGVFRCSGGRLVRFTVKHGLDHDRIRGIQEDAAGSIYFRTLGGISKFDGRAFTTLLVAKTGADARDWRSEPGDLWFTSNQDDNGVFRYDGKALHHFEFPPHPMAKAFYAQTPVPPYNPYQVYFVYSDRKGDVWLGTSTLGVCRFDGKSLSWMYEEHHSQPGGGRSFGVRSIIEDRSGDFWFCNTKHRYKIKPGYSTSDGANWIDYDRKDGVGFFEGGSGVDHPYFMSVTEDDSGDLWMAALDRGVFRYDGERLIRYPIEDGGRTIAAYSVYKDRQGVLWLGTLQGGAFRYDGTSFKKFGL